MVGQGPANQNPWAHIVIHFGIAKYITYLLTDIPDEQGGNPKVVNGGNQSQVEELQVEPTQSGTAVNSGTGMSAKHVFDCKCFS